MKNIIKLVLKSIRNNELLGIPFKKYIRNSEYRSELKKIKHFYKLPEKEQEEYVLEKLKNMVTYAYEHTIFYKKLYDDNKFNPYDIKDFSDISKIPIIDKDMVKKNLNEIISDEFNNIDNKVDFTGGSTNSPMKFYIDRRLYYREQVFYELYWNKFGYKFGDRCVILRGHKVADISKNKVYQYDRIDNYLLLDSRYLNIEYLHYYDSIIKKYNAEFIQAYPSSIYMLAKLYKESNLNAPRFKCVFLGSENIYDYQIDLIKRVFNTEHICNQYGLSEKTVLALEDENKNDLCFLPNYGYMELINEVGKNIKKNNQIGEIISTGFNKCMPLIRYRTGDLAKFSESNNNNSIYKRIKKIEGRLQEFVYTKDDRKISIAAIAGADHLKNCEKILDLQYIQNIKGYLMIEAIEDKNHPLNYNEKENLVKSFNEAFNNEVECSLVLVDELNKTSRNKKSLIIQNVDKS